MFIGISFHIAILHYSCVTDTLENELPVNDLCKQFAHHKHHFALHKIYDASPALWEKVFYKTGQNGSGIFILYECLSKDCPSIFRGTSGIKSAL